MRIVTGILIIFISLLTLLTTNVFAEGISIPAFKTWGTPIPTVNDNVYIDDRIYDSIEAGEEIILTSPAPTATPAQQALSQKDKDLFGIIITMVGVIGICAIISIYRRKDE